MEIIQGIVVDDTGFHARPATISAKEAQRFKSDIIIHYMDKESSMKSMLGIMKMEIPSSAKIKITLEGEDELEAVKAISDMLTTKRLVDLKM